MPPYRLQVLQDMRARAKEEAEQAFAASVEALKKEKVELQRLIDELERRKRERKEKVAAYLKEVMAKGAGINGMNMMSRFEQRLKDEEAQVALEVERQREAVKVAERVMEQRRQAMADATMELKAIEKHKETWQKQVKHERQQREELSQEEIGNALFLARQRK
ncbi:flagellar assembly protein FliH [Pyxidicoccus trucidator]|uniref:flagellar assembly protein FliH n=1 Tax=Pyxidicoccus trucidator TaxID=2709662 RepID=UPI0013D97852|nr:flagellar assembly protein FliH [Pyxidicoccus trucidator]